MGPEADFVELRGEGVEGAERRDVEDESLAEPNLPFKGAFRRNRVYPLLGQIHCPGVGFEPRSREGGEELGKSSPPTRRSSPLAAG